jgi:hypothetical protein
MILPARMKIFLIILLCMMVTGLLIHFAKPLLIETDPPMQNLPDGSGGWQGCPILFCQNDQCCRSWTPDTAQYEGGQPLCPVCNGKLDPWSLGERRSLDPNTLLSHRLYTNTTQGRLTISLVVSPSNVNSIHRPQTCLFGQGYRIVKQEEMTVPLRNRPPLKLTLLQLSRQSHDATGRATEITSFVAYRFMDKRRQTPSHTSLTFHLIWDRLAHGRLSRWAYITISSEWDVSESVFRQQVNDLIDAFYSGSH